MTKRHDLRAVWLGRVDYQACRTLQNTLVERIAARESPETLLLAEHHPVITRGRGAFGREVLLPPDIPAIPVYDVGRGGGAAWHGPGQLMVYPLLRLRDRTLDVKKYVRLLERMIVALLARHGITGFAGDGLSGVWTSPTDNIASIGAAVRRGVCLHGAAVNASVNPAHCNMVNAYGDGTRMVSMESVGGRAVSMDALQRSCTAAFGEVFGVTVLTGETLPDDVAAALGARPCPVCWSCGACGSGGKRP